MTSATGSRIARKMHGAENAFVVLDERPAAFSNYPELARRVCAPDGGFEGADGLLVVSDAPDAAAEMRVYNADGSEAEMCGNGVRCVARYLFEHGAGERFTIATLAGPIATQIVAREPFAARVDIGPVVFPNGEDAKTLTIDDTTWTYYDVSLGNPHAVVFVDDVATIDLATLGPAFGAAFERGTNLHVVQILDTSTLRVRHYERGAGMTQACGTGAVASAAVAIVARGGRAPITVHVPGGTLIVDWTRGTNASLTGPAQTLFERSLAP
jgi:diaminopimelate epimerase